MRSDRDTLSLGSALHATVLVVATLLGVVGTAAVAQEDAANEPITQEELFRQHVDGADGPDVVWIRRVELAPDAAMAPEPEIEHPAEEFVYVLQGTATLDRQGEEPLTYEPGEAWYNDFEQPHTLRNASSTAPLVVIAVWIGDEGAF